MTDDKDIDALAGEYVLGSLSDGERTAVTARLGRDATLAIAVKAWERRLSPLGLREPGLAPPATALASILAGIIRNMGDDRSRETVVPLVRRANRWRRAALAMAAMLASVVIGIGTQLDWQLPGSTASLIAVLDRPSNNPAADEPETATGPVFVATMQAGSRSLSIRQVAGRRPPAGRSYAIWLMKAAGNGAVLLGTFDRGSRSATFQMPDRSMADAAGRGLAVSVESEGLITAPTSAFVSTGTFAGASR